jgi:hypothetical protein
MDTLPTLTLTLREFDPNWVAVFEPGNNCAINTDTMQKDYEIKVEVVQLNLNTGGMRVRYDWPTTRTKKGYEVKSRDVSIEHFYKAFDIVAK